MGKRKTESAVCCTVPERPAGSNSQSERGGQGKLTIDSNSPSEGGGDKVNSLSERGEQTHCRLTLTELEGGQGKLIEDSNSPRGVNKVNSL